MAPGGQVQPEQRHCGEIHVGYPAIIQERIAALSLKNRRHTRMAVAFRQALLQRSESVGHADCQSQQTHLEPLAHGFPFGRLQLCRFSGVIC
jgi:hypothetical protein